MLARDNLFLTLPVIPIKKYRYSVRRDGWGHIHHSHIP